MDPQRPRTRGGAGPGLRGSLRRPSLRTLLLASALLPGPPLLGGERPLELLTRTWQTDEGLPVNVVVAIAQTRDRYVWLGTEEGLVRFDGARFTVFDHDTAPQLGEGCVRGLAASRDGGLWVVTCSGSLFQQKGNAFERIGAAGSLGKGPISPVLEDAAGIVWIGTEGRGLARVENGTIRLLGSEAGLPSLAVNALCAGGPGEVWAGTRDGLALVRDGRVARVLTARDGLTDGNVRSLAREKDGALRVATGHGGLHRYVGGVVEPSAVKAPANVISLAVDREGRLFAGTNGAGVLLVKDREATAVPGLAALRQALAQQLLVDADGALWICTTGMGVSRAIPRTVRMVTPADGLSGEIVLPLLEDRAGALWAGTAGAGLNVLRDGRWSRFGKGDGLSSEVVFALAEDAEGRLLVGTSVGLDRLEGKRFVPVPGDGGPVRPAVSSLLLGRDGTLWAGTHTGGLVRIANGTATRITGKDGLSSDRVACLREDRDGRLLAGTSAGGLDVLEGGKVVSRGAAGPLAGFQVMCLHEDRRGVLWAGTADRGLVRLEGSRRTVFGRAQGLLDETVFAIVEDEREVLWMTCNRGIFAVARTELDAVARGEAASVKGVALGKADGMSTRECNGGVFPAASRRRDGTLWFPTVRGIAVVDPATVGPPPPLPAAVLERVEVDGVPLAPGAAPALLPAGSRRLDVTFAAPDFSDPESLRFQVRLEPFDRAWLLVGSRRTVTYTNLEPGPYTLSVATVRGAARGTAATLALGVKPRFYRTVPFALACLAALALAVEGFVRLRQRRQHAMDQAALAEQRRAQESVRALNEELERRVAARTAELEAANRELETFAYTVSHDLRAPLRAVDGFSQALAEECGERLGDEGREHLGRIRAGTRRMAELIDAILGLSRLSRGDLSRESVDLTALARSIVADLRARDPGRVVEVEIAGGLEASGDRVLLRAVLENLVGNAWKFTARRGTGRIELGREEGADGTPVFFVRDDGAGFDMTRAGKLFDPFQRLHGAREFPGLGVGLATVQRIVKRHGGRVWAEGETGRGATFRFTLGPGG